MSVDPRAPVLIGCGQVRQKVDDPRDGVEPLDSMLEAARLAERDSGARGLLSKLDAILVPRGLWKYANPAAWLRERLSASGAVTGLASISGNMVQHMISHSAREISAGRRDLVLVAGAEAEHSKRRARSRGIDLGWTVQTGPEPDLRFGGEGGDVSDHEVERGLAWPAVFFSLFENALRFERGESLDAHRERISRLWQGFSRIAASNPHAWSREPLDAETIRTPSADNRMTAWPYPKRMCANLVVDLSAAVIVCAWEVARRLGVPCERCVFIHAATDVMQAPLLSHRRDFVSIPALRVAGQRALELADASIDEIEHLDLYSCFPAAVQLAAKELEIPLDRPLTVTGGLGFAGGPFNSYVLHSTARMLDVLRDEPGTRGLVTSVGGFVSKHSFGVYGSEPPASGFRFEDVPLSPATAPRRELSEDFEGSATIETYALRYVDGEPSRATLACLDADGIRSWACSEDREVLDDMTRHEWIGRPVRVRRGGGFEAG